MKNLRSTPRLLPIFSLLVAGLCFVFSLEVQAYEPDAEFADVVDSNGISFATMEEIDNTWTKTPRTMNSSICDFGLGLAIYNDNNDNDIATGIKILEKYASKDSINCMIELIDLHTGTYDNLFIPKLSSVDIPRPNTASIEKAKNLIDKSKLINYAYNFKRFIETYPYPQKTTSPTQKQLDTLTLYSMLMKLHLEKTAPFYDPHKAIEAGQSALEILPIDSKCSFTIDLCKIYNNKDLPVYNPTQCIKNLEQYNNQAPKALPKDISYYSCASGQMLILSEMFKTGNGVPLNTEKAALLEKYSKEFEETAKRLSDKEIAAIDAKHRAESERLRQQEADDFLSVLGAVVGAVAPIVTSGGNYVPPPSSYSSGSSGNASDTVNAALNAVITGMGGTSSTVGSTTTPGGDIDTATHYNNSRYDNTRYSENNPSANNTSQRSGQNTGSKDDDDRAYEESRRSPPASPSCIQLEEEGRVKVYGHVWRNVCKKRISVTGVCLPPQNVLKDYPYKGTYTASGSDSFTLKPGETWSALSGRMCTKDGGTYHIYACDASTKKTENSMGHATSPDFQKYQCYR